MSKGMLESRNDIVATIQSLLGAMLFVAPWVLGFAEHGAAAWTAWLTGAAIFLFGVVSFADDASWPAWTNLVVGIWAVISPWVAQFSTVDAAIWTHVVIGAAVAASSLWELLGGENWTPRVTA